MARKRGSKNVGSRAAAAAPQGNAVDTEAVATAGKVAAVNKSDVSTVDRALATAGDGSDDAARHELGDVLRAEPGAVEGARPETDGKAPPVVEGSQNAAAAAGTAGQEAHAQPQQAGISQEEDADELTFKSPLDVAELARGVASAARFFTSNMWDGSDIFSREEAAIMADFVRGNPDAPVEAMFIHLSLQKRYPRTEPNTADRFVLGLFHAAASAAFKFEADRAAEEATAQAKPERSGGWPGEQALQPSQPAFAPTGFSPR